MLRSSSEIAGSLAFVCFAGLVAVSAPPALATGADYKKYCASQVAAARSLSEKIRLHNASPPAPTNIAAVQSYNARASSLNAQKGPVAARLLACARAFSQMRANHPLATVVTPSADAVKKINDAVSKMKSRERRAGSRWNPETYDFLKYGRGKPGMTSRADRRPVRLPRSIRAVYDALDKTRPSIPTTAYLQGVRAPRIGSADPAYLRPTNPASPSRLITGVAFDHIIPLRRLVTYRGFLELTPRNMYIVANSPANSQWLSRSANSSKQSGSSFFISGADPAWLQAQAKLREKAAKEVQELIKALLKSQKA
ncbi:hypothetical protein [Sinosporangium siamense]|uniref:DUF1524 domain-containing protein n=1 Tax=Sinosporangium siamense TaxID=1367973 RepID=A0A919RLY9_9ACTN|nr:hypothetical protein [Sinosporangium siamense]GII95270.1 hypothetical protein Ssi02_55010 [Sinosporangium siamense]